MVSTIHGRHATGQTTTADGASIGAKRAAICHGPSSPKSVSAIRTLPEALAEAARIGPDDAIVYHRPGGPEKTQSYAELLESAGRIRAGLGPLGLKPRDVVLLQLADPQEVIETFWGCVLGGCWPLIMSVPPAYDQPNAALDKLLAIHQFLDKPWVVTSRDLKDAVSAALAADQRQTPVADVESLAEHAAETGHYVADPHETAMLNLSSGSTGRPKCIMLSHANLLSRAAGTNWLCDHRPTDRVLNWLPFDHIGSISDWHIRCVAIACRAVYAETAGILAHPLRWLELMQQYRITHSWAPNFAYALVRDAAGESPDRPWDLRSVRSLLTAGESVTSEVVQGFLAALAPCGLDPSCIRPAFGMAELGSGVTYAAAQSELVSHAVSSAAIGEPAVRIAPDDPAAKTFADLGRVIPGVSMRIVDEQDRLLAEETVGRLQIHGSAVFSGYFGDPQATAEAFTADGWFRTGDVGFITGARLVLTGREKETIIINGANHHNHELEAVVERVAGVDVSYTAACAVRGPSDSSDAVAIFFHPLDDDQTTWPTLQQAIRTALVGGMGVNPAYVIPIDRQEIPKTSIGKIQRSALARRFEHGEFDAILSRISQIAEDRRAAVEPPTDQREQTIVEVWRQVLGLERIGRHDSFFDLGGQSLHLAQVRGKLLDEHQIDVTLITLLAHPTVSALAGHLSAGSPDTGASPPDRDRLQARKSAVGRRRARRLAARSVRRNGV